ncbi:DNA polymerase I [Candidatus Falkowbacteria bacterium CG1_02_37_44]|uniref:DNA polymerase I n=3 Tax=Candidatus Falkowiibacteriota TaxID=1752728 RepID=A0A1J4T765_9BACT|nr:MAG: DNA polymerase I [Candidatus Falkowbacteria bacterium CG1_02_37_44]PIX11325.1 MAG: DNA polymerase I [Candidatus Falkowbacteria bacterium CG_4_8_14_3_um_filter_36_11]
MVKKTNGRLIIIDGNALIHRSFHALPPTMATKKGEVVNAVYGFTTALIKAIREFRPEYIALTLDKKGPTFRHIAYEKYKATRIKAPDELYKQIPRVKEVVKAFNIPIYEMSGFEADDLIGTICHKVDGEIEKIILTGDLDTLQLVNKHTKVYTLSRGISDSVVYDEQAVFNRFNLLPRQMIDYKALRGDPSDNIPGVKGIGEKGAIGLLLDFKTLEGVYKNIDSEKIKDRTKELLKKYKNDAILSKKLATIKIDVKVDFKLEEALFKDINNEKIVKLFSELEFKSLLPRVQEITQKQKRKKVIKQKSGRDKSPYTEASEDKFERNKKLFKYLLVDDDKKFKSFLLKLKKQKTFAFDTETSSFDPITAQLLGISFSWKAGEAYYLKLKIKNEKVKDDVNNLFNYKENNNCQENPWLKELKPIFTDKKIKKYGHNIKFDIRVIKNNGTEATGIEFDTMIASYLLNPGTRQHNLDDLTFAELGFEKISKDDLLGTGWDKITFSAVEIEKLYLYSCEDADFTFRLVNKLRNKLKAKGLAKLFKEMEMPLVPILAKMEDNGISLDKKILIGLGKKVFLDIKKLEKKIYKTSGEKFNINSPKQLQVVLFEKMAIAKDGIKKTKTGISTSADELVKMIDLHPIIKLIQSYRELSKLYNTYIKALPELINKKTERIHTSYNQAVTATGRLSSTEPNLQNIPIKTELGREIRKAFVAKRGYKLLALDYSQIELRLAAHMSGDDKMIKVFKAGVDIHTQTAAEINGIKLDEVTAKMRREAKAINFGILYGQGPHGLAQTADIPYWRAKEFIDSYFTSFPGIKKFIDKIIKKAQTDGYVETLFGRRRFLPEINSSVVMVRKGAERMAVNTPIQGTAADMIKFAMIEVSRMLSENGANNKELKKTSPQPLQFGGQASPSQGEGGKMLLQVHDELLFEVKDEYINEASEKIKNIMENVIKLKVPVIVDASAGDNWGEMFQIKMKK